MDHDACHDVLELVARVQLEAAESSRYYTVPCSQRGYICTRVAPPTPSKSQGVAFPWPCSAEVPIPGPLADAVAALSSWLGRDTCPLEALLDTPAGARLGSQVQRLYCKGSLQERFLTPEAVEQSPVAVTFFLRGLFAVASAIPLSTTVDSGALLQLAGPIASGLDDAAQLPDAEAGKTRV